MLMQNKPIIFDRAIYYWVLTLASSLIMLVGILYQQDSPLKKAIPTNNSPLFSSLQADASSEIQLIDVSLDWNMSFLHQQASKGITAITDTLGAGVCAIDYNNDGWTDLYFVGGSGNTRRYGGGAWWHKATGGRLFENHQGRYLEDVTKKTGLDFTSSGMGCAIDDLNGDGFSDIFITGIDSNYLFKNNGDGSFSEITPLSIKSSPGWSTGAIFGDFNNDGLPDLYIAKFIKFNKDVTTLETNSGFQSFDSAAFNASLYDPEPNQLLMNKGDFSFEDVTEKYNVANKNGRSLGSRWVNINNDIWLDLVVINMPPSPNEVYINQGGDEFVLINDKFNSLRGAGNNDFINIDFNNDAQIDFFLTSNDQNPLQLISQKNLNTSNGQYQFKDVSHMLGLTNTKLTSLSHWGAVASDFNNDGYLDIFIANGKLIPDSDSRFTSLSQPNTVLINQFGKRFFLSNNTVVINNSSRAAISTDLNNDGVLEVIVTNNNGSTQILKSYRSKEDKLKTHNWIGFELKNKNSIGWGAGEIKIKYGGMQQVRSLAPSSGYLSQSESRLHFGLGYSKKIDQLIVKGQNKLFTVSNLESGYYYTVDLLTHDIRKNEYTEQADPLDFLIESIDTNALVPLEKIILKNNNPEHTQVLSKIWEKSDSDQRLLILKSFTKISTLFELNLVKLALSEPNKKSVITAINVLKQSEIDQTMGSLIEQLYAESSDVQCTVANAISFFFKEEEAMITQKGLALKHLIIALENGTEHEKICIAKTLGISESKRAVIPLIKIILAHPLNSTSLNIAAIDALSEIRDSLATNALIAFVNLSSSKPDEVGAALIALARMNFYGLNNALQELIYSKLVNSHQSGQIEAIYLLNSLYRHPNMIFINRYLDEENINSIIKKILLILRDESINLLSNKELSLAIINIASSRRDISFIDFLQSASKSEYQSVREEAIVALLKVTPTTNTQKKMIKETLIEQSVDTLIALLNVKNISALDRLIISSTLENKIRITKLNSKKIEDLFSILDNDAKTMLLSKLLLINLKDGQQKILLNICAKKELPIKVSELKKISIRTKFKRDLLACVYNPNAIHTSVPEKVTYQLRKILNNIIHDSRVDFSYRQEIFVTAMVHDIAISKQFLNKYFGRFLEKNMFVALNAIESHQLIERYNSLIWSTMKNTKNSDALRMQAAWLASKTSEKEVNKFLEKGFIVK